MKNTVKRRLFAAAAVLFALCVPGCPNPWLNRMFKGELEAVTTPPGFAQPDTGGGTGTGTAGSESWYAAVTAGSAESRFLDIAVDSQGNAYCVGRTIGNGTVDFGNGTTFTGPAGGAYENAVMVKYDPQGRAQWASGVMSGSGNSSFVSIALGGSGDIYVTGNTGGSGITYNFGLANITTGTTTDAGVIVKYSSGGIPLYQTAPTTTSSYVPFGKIAVDSSENVYATGMKYGVADYGNGQITANSSYDTAVLVKYDATLTAQWVQTGSGSFTHYFGALAVGADGSIYTGGYNNGDSLVFNGQPPLGSGYSAIIVKWNGAGNALWAKKAQGGSNASFRELAVYGGAVYAAGTQNGTDTRDYGGGVFAAGPSTGINAVLVKFNAADGAAIWAKTAETGGAGAFTKLAVEGSGVYIAGYQTGTGPFTYGGGISAAATAAGTNSLLVKYNDGGTAQYARTVSAGAADSEFLGMVLGGNSLYLTGYQTGTGTYTYFPSSLAGGSAGKNAVVMRCGK
ncbi:MAG: hypothetical protein LBI86_06335 [Treponema sp.]|jgi:hypothetical protein|nr:hypothetical protein [Treponema sp.]